MEMQYLRVAPGRLLERTKRVTVAGDSESIIYLNRNAYSANGREIGEQVEAHLNAGRGRNRTPAEWSRNCHYRDELFPIYRFRVARNALLEVAARKCQ